MTVRYAGVPLEELEGTRAWHVAAGWLRRRAVAELEAGGRHFTFEVKRLLTAALREQASTPDEHRKEAPPTTTQLANPNTGF